jgi:hypothetical protein
MVAEMTITARNYAAQAVRGLQKWVAALPASGVAVTGARATLMAAAIERSVHFALPDGGKVFDDGAKGLRGLPARLPYPMVTIEYYAPKPAEPSEVLPAHPTKRVIVIQETTSAAIQALDPGDKLSEFDDTLLVVTACWEVGEYWIPALAMAILPSSSWDREIGEEKPVLEPLHPLEEGEGTAFYANFRVFLPELFDQTQRMVGQKRAMQLIVHDIGDEVAAVLEVLEALAVSNVTSEPLAKVDPKKNARRVKAGKSPIWETRVLVINPHRAQGQAGASQGVRTGPREHLRRGHIRRLEDGRRIWVQSCLVGSAERGRIDKSYWVRDGGAKPGHSRGRQEGLCGT